MTLRKTFHISYSAEGQRKKASKLPGVKYHHYESVLSAEDVLGRLVFGERRGERSALILT